MFEGFALTGLTIDALTAQVVGFLNNAFVVGVLLATLALPFSVRIVRAIRRIAGSR